MTNLLHVPKDANPSKKTWMWIGLGTLAAVGVGAAYYRSKKCDIPKVSNLKTLRPSVVHTTHPEALTAAELDGMKVGDEVGVALGVRDNGAPHNIRPEEEIKVVRGKLTLNQEGIETFNLDCNLPQPRAVLLTTGPVIMGNGEYLHGFGQYAGHLFPRNKVGMLVAPKYIAPHELAG